MIKDIENKIGNFFASSLNGFSYEPKKNRLVRKFDGGWQAIVLTVLQSSQRVMYKISGQAQIRLDNLENVYARHHPFLAVEDFESHQTVARNCDNLIQDKSLIHAFRVDELLSHAFLEKYASALVHGVVPWLEKYSIEDELFAGLVDIDPKNWITTDRLTRFPVLLAILSRRDDRPAFDAVLAEFVRWCQRPFATEYAPLAVAMNKIRPKQ